MTTMGLSFYDHNDMASRVVLNDATERQVDICHFHGSSMLGIHLQLSRQREIRVDAATAERLAFVFDFFARHQSLPDRHYSCREDDYSI